LGRIYQGAKTCRQTVHVVPPTRDVDGQGEMSLVESSAAVGGAGDQQVRAIARLVLITVARWRSSALRTWRRVGLLARSRLCKSGIRQFSAVPPVTGHGRG